MKAETEERVVSGCALTLAVLGALVLALGAICSGCAPRYTVVASDREVVPVRQSVSAEGVAERRTYVEDEAGATGWYVPDAVMLELLEAD